MPRLKPRAAGWEVLPLGYAASLDEELYEGRSVLISFDDAYLATISVLSLFWLRALSQARYEDGNQRFVPLAF